MTAKIIDGKALAARIQDELKTRVEACTEHGHRPGLAVVLVGEDPASQNLGLEIVGFIRKFCDECSQREKLNYTCLATPAEGLRAHGHPL